MCRLAHAGWQSKNADFTSLHTGSETGNAVPSLCMHSGREWVWRSMLDFADPSRRWPRPLLVAGLTCSTCFEVMCSTAVPLQGGGVSLQPCGYMLNCSAIHSCCLHPKLHRECAGIRPSFEIKLVRLFPTSNTTVKVLEFLTDPVSYNSKSCTNATSIPFPAQSCTATIRNAGG